MSEAAAPPALLAALREAGRGLAVERVDRVWLFVARQVGSAESSLAVLSLFDPDGTSERRRILTLHCTATTDRGRVRRDDQWVEQGIVPADRVDRMIQGVLHRLRDDRELARSEQIGGDALQWATLVGDIGGDA